MYILPLCLTYILQIDYLLFIVIIYSILYMVIITTLSCNKYLCIYIYIYPLHMFVSQGYE